MVTCFGVIQIKTKIDTIMSFKRHRTDIAKANPLFFDGAHQSFSMLLGRWANCCINHSFVNHGASLPFPFNTYTTHKKQLTKNRNI